MIPDQSFDRAETPHDFIKQRSSRAAACPRSRRSWHPLPRGRPTSPLIDHLDDIGAHYAETLRRWRANLIHHAEEIEGPETGTALIDHAGLRLFHLYLCYCEAAFLERHVSDVQLVFTGRRWRP